MSKVTDDMLQFYAQDFMRSNRLPRGLEANWELPIHNPSRENNIDEREKYHRSMVNLNLTWARLFPGVSVTLEQDRLRAIVAQKRADERALNPEARFAYLMKGDRWEYNLLDSGRTYYNGADLISHRSNWRLSDYTVAMIGAYIGHGYDTDSNPFEGDLTGKVREALRMSFELSEWEINFTRYLKVQLSCPDWL